MDSHILLDGLPGNIVPTAQEKFRAFLTNFIDKKLGHKNFAVHFCTDEATGLVNGAILSFTNPGESERALALLNKVAITKSDMLFTYRWRDLEDAKSEIVAYEAPQPPKDDSSTELSNAMMEDTLARPMFLLKNGDKFDAELFWFDNFKGEIELFKKPTTVRDDNLGQMTDMDRRAKKAQPGIISSGIATAKPCPIWSPLGSMLVSQHHTGLKFWGGPNFELLFEVEESNIAAFLISPMENYLIMKTDRELTVWDLKQSKKLRTIGGIDLQMWPIAKFNADDTLLAVCKDGKLSVYDAQNDMKLVQGHAAEKHNYTVELDNLEDFDWSPKEPAHMSLIFSGTSHAGWKIHVEEVSVTDNVLSLKNQIRRNFLSAVKVATLWHPEGSGIAAKITKMEKNEEVTEYCLFRLSRFIWTADIFKIESKYVPSRFAWQPAGKYFAITLVDKTSDPTAITGLKQVIRFYAFDSGVKLVGNFPTIATSLHWSPKGARLVAASYEKSLFEFYGINESGVAVFFERQEHTQVSDTQWDPSGRFFASWNSVLRCPEGNRYKIYDLNGRRLMDKGAKNLSHFGWRPLAKQVLTDSEVAEVKANLKQIVNRYLNDEKRLEDEKKAKEVEQRKKIEDAFIARMNAIAEHHRKHKYTEEREALRASAPNAKRQLQKLAAVAETDRIVVEDRTTVRIVKYEAMEAAAAPAASE